MAPPGNQVATEKTNIDLQHRESPVYSTDIPGALNNLGSAVSAANIAFGHVRSSSDVIHAAITYAAFLE